MTTPKSSRTESTLQGKTNMSKVVTFGEQGNGDVSEESLTREDLEKAFNEAKKSAAHLRKIIDTIPTLAWCNLSDGSNEFVNQRWCDYTGLSPEEVRRRGCKVVIHPEDFHRVTDTWEELLRSEKPGEFEARLRRYDGVFRWFLFRAEPKRNQAGAVVSWYGTATDIEDRKRMESLHAAEMRTLQMITDGASLAEILDYMCSSIDLQISPSVTTILLMDPDGKRLWKGGGPRVPHEWISRIIPVPVAFEAGLCGTAAFLRARVIVPDVATEPNWPDQYRDLAIRNDIRAAWSEPILTKDNEVLGTFAVYSHQPRVPTDEDLALIEGAGHIALIAIERQRSQEALRTALDEIRQSEEELRSITDAIAQTIVVLNTDGRAIYANRVALEYTGLSLDEVRADDFRARVFHPDDVQRVFKERQKALSGTVPFENEQRVLGKDGKYRWFLIRYNPLLDENGKVFRWYATGTDIEDRKQAEDKLRQDERELRQLIDFLPQHVVVLDTDGKLLQANKTMLEYNGYTLEEMQGAGTQERIKRDLHPDDLERANSERTAGLSRGVPFEIEKRLLGKDGRYRWFLFRYKPVLNEDGQIVRWFATATDIEDRKHAEDRMRNETVALREDIMRSSMFEEIVGSSQALRKI
jgi:PAS domain S-box-containing protein